jgi:phospholipid/cholesterol/gamma-HCH transport system ATP-binding protein
MPKPDPIISVKNLSAWFEERLILEHLNFSVFPGEIFFVIGGSGSGKTTLLRSLIGLHQNLSGEILIDGQNIVTTLDEERLEILKKIGVMFQSGALFGSSTILENVMFPLEELGNLPQNQVEAIARKNLELVGLANFVDYFPAEISGGMQKRAAIARALGLNPKIIFFDEPSSGLDPITAAQIDRLILNLSQTLKTTFVVISHDLASIFAIAERVIMLHDKNIIAEGDPKKLLASTTNVFVRKFFSREV